VTPADNAPPSRSGRVRWKASIPSISQNAMLVRGRGLLRLWFTGSVRIFESCSSTLAPGRGPATSLQEAEPTIGPFTARPVFASPRHGAHPFCDESYEIVAQLWDCNTHVHRISSLPSESCCVANRIRLPRMRIRLWDSQMNLDRPIAEAPATWVAPRVHRRPVGARLRASAHVFPDAFPPCSRPSP